MYDGISKNDLRVILAHQNFIRLLWLGHDVKDDNRNEYIAKCLSVADRFLGSVEALNAESESIVKRDDGEGEGTRA